MKYNLHCQKHYRVDVQVFILTALLIILACLGVVAVYESVGSNPRLCRRLIITVIVLGCLLSAAAAMFFFRHLSNPCFQSLATTDYLTELKNRNAFDVAMSNLEGRAEGMGIILVDLNDLKAVNDTMGHAYGDRYLRHAANVISAHQSRSRTAYRVGGDEFVLLCADATEAQLNALCEHLCQSYSACRPGWPIPTSLSVGWAVYQSTCDPSFRETLRRADEAMYFQKREFHSEDAH